MSKQCFEQAHMTCAEFGLWVQYRKLSYASKVLYCDGRRTAERFSGESYQHIYRLRRSLIKKGWLVVTQKQKHTKDGLYSATVFEVLDHKSWVEKHGGKHCKTKLFEGFEPLSPVKMTVVTGENGPLSPVKTAEGNPVSPLSPVKMTVVTGENGPLSPVKTAEGNPVSPLSPVKMTVVTGENGPLSPVTHSSKKNQLQIQTSSKSLRLPFEELETSKPADAQISREGKNVPPLPPVKTVNPEPVPSTGMLISQAVDELAKLDRAKAMAVYNRHTKDGRYPHTVEMLGIIRSTIEEAKSAEVSR